MSVYRRTGNRAGWYFMARTRTGRAQLATRTSRRRIAESIATMWNVLADERAWDLTDPVVNGERSIGSLYDLWCETEHSLSSMRRRLADRDIEPLVDTFLLAYRARGVRPDTVKHIEAHVRWLVPTGTTRLVSSVTPAWLSDRLVSYVLPPLVVKPKRQKEPTEGVAPEKPKPNPPRPATANTRRKVHSSWSTFFGYLTHPLGVFATNPMLEVDRPALQRPPILFYEPDEVKLLIERATDPAMAALWALMYGTGVEVSVALTLVRHDIDESTWELRARGTKTHTRDRIVLVAEWARPYIAAHIIDKLPAAPLWPGYTRWTPLDAHAAAAKVASLRILPLRHSRHAWAVRAARAGTPVSLIAAQLGHASSQLTLTTYGRFLPQASDRALWERRAAERDTAGQLSAKIVEGGALDRARQVEVPQSR